MIFSASFQPRATCRGRPCDHSSCDLRSRPFSVFSSSNRYLPEGLNTMRSGIPRRYLAPMMHICFGAYSLSHLWMSPGTCSHRIPSASSSFSHRRWMSASRSTSAPELIPRRLILSPSRYHVLPLCADSLAAAACQRPQYCSSRGTACVHSGSDRT